MGGLSRDVQSLCSAKCKYSMTCENDWRDRYIQGKNGFWLQYVVTVYRFNAQISTPRYMAWFVPFVFKIAPTPHLPNCRKVRSFWSLWRLIAWSKKPAMFLSSYRISCRWEAPHTPLQRRSEGLVQGNNIRFFYLAGGGVHGMRFFLGGDSVGPDGFQWNAWFIISDWLLTVEHVQSFCWRLLSRIKHQSFVGLPQRHWKSMQLIHFRKALFLELLVKRDAL